jgi:GT2 family glycosyltransferase
MNRDTLEFLDAMFIHNDKSEFQILIINQTQDGKVLESDLPNIRIINCFEKGLSRSRNLAIENALSSIVLISDDDVVFGKDFHKTILNAFNKKPDACLITFKAKNFNGLPYRNYPENNLDHNLKTIKGVISWEIALNLNNLKSLNVKFDERFGLGSEFETAEEYLFSREVISKKGPSYFYDAFIVAHPNYNSGMDLGSDKIVYARSALNYKLYGFKAYFWIPKYLFFLIRHRFIKWNELHKKCRITFKAINDYIHPKYL